MKRERSAACIKTNSRGCCRWPMISQMGSLGRSFPVPSVTTARVPSRLRHAALLVQHSPQQDPRRQGGYSLLGAARPRSWDAAAAGTTPVLLPVRPRRVSPGGAGQVPPRMLSTRTRSSDTRDTSARRSGGRAVPEPQLHFLCPCPGVEMGAGILLVSQPLSLLRLPRGRGQFPREVERGQGARSA